MVNGLSIGESTEHSIRIVAILVAGLLQVAGNSLKRSSSFLSTQLRWRVKLGLESRIRIEVTSSDGQTSAK